MGNKSSKIKPTKFKETTEITVAPTGSATPHSASSTTTKVLQRTDTPVIIATNSEGKGAQMLHHGLKITGGKKIITIVGAKKVL